MNIGIVGMGVVGAAVADGLRPKGYTVYSHDKTSDRTSFTLETLTKECEIIFVCVPTPRLPSGECNVSAVWEVIGQLDELDYKGIVAVKSTVPPDSVERLTLNYPNLQLAFNPEFLRAKHALGDFLYPDRIVIGSLYPTAIVALRKLYHDFPATIIETDPVTASLIKYLSNAFLLLKVAFSEEAKRISEAIETNPVTILNGVSLDKRIGDSHMNPLFGPVPQDSPCLPKDLEAFRFFLKEKGIVSELIEQTWKIGVKHENVRDDRH